VKCGFITESRVSDMRKCFSVLLLSIQICLPFRVTAGSTEHKSTNELRALELICSSANRPNPHSPFWIASQQIGLVVGQEEKRELVGELLACDLATKDVKKLFGKYVWYPTFVPKLNRLAFATGGKHGGITLFTKSLNGNDLREYNLSESAVFGPSWSPDGRKVVFANASYLSQLIIADVESGRTEDIGDLGYGKETAGTEMPDWSPNGKEIVYVGWDKASQLEGGGYVPRISRLYIFDLEARTYRRLTDGTFQDREAAYSPDGKQIAFVSNRSRNFELWVVNRDGANLRKLTDVGKQGLQVARDKPAWSPDQRKIVFSLVPVAKQPKTGGFPFEGSTIWILELSNG
jgi:Tol biopolymer transport system component